MFAIWKLARCGRYDITSPVPSGVISTGMYQISLIQGTCLWEMAHRCNAVQYILSLLYAYIVLDWIWDQFTGGWWCCRHHIVWKKSMCRGSCFCCRSKRSKLRWCTQIQYLFLPPYLQSPLTPYTTWKSSWTPSQDHLFCFFTRSPEILRRFCVVLGT